MAKESTIDSGEVAFEKLGQQDKLFVDFVAAGELHYRAWWRSGRKSEAMGTASACATRKLKDGKVALALRWRQKQALAENGVTTERVMAEIAHLAFSRLDDLTSVDGKGEVSFKDWGQADARQLAAVAEVAETPAGTKIKMHSKPAALAKLVDILGMNAPQKVELTTPEDAAAQIRAVLAESLPEDEADRVAAILVGGEHSTKADA